MVDLLLRGLIGIYSQNVLSMCCRAFGWRGICGNRIIDNWQEGTDKMDSIAV